MAQPLLAHKQTLWPDSFEGARWIPKVLNPHFSPFTVFAFPELSNFMI